MPEQTLEAGPITHGDLKYALGRLDAKVDMLLAGQDRRDLVLKEVSDRLGRVEVEVATLKTEKTTTKSNLSSLWAFVAAIAAFGVSAWQAWAGR
jgi:hypothetical protein